MPHGKFSQTFNQQILTSKSLFSHFFCNSYVHMQQQPTYHNTGDWSKVVFIVAVITQSICWQALRYIVGIIIWHDHQRTWSARTLANTVLWPSASSTLVTARMAILADAILVPVLEVGTFRHAVRPVTCIPTVVTHIGTLSTAPWWNKSPCNKNIKNDIQTSITIITNRQVLVSTSTCRLVIIAFVSPSLHGLSVYTGKW